MLPEYPATSTYWSALEFCKWYSGKIGKVVRLPSEAEWEYAATGGLDQLYPYGRRFVQLESSFRVPADVDQDWQLRNLSRVDDYPLDASVFGVRGTLTNGQNWVLDLGAQDYFQRSQKTNPLNVKVMPVKRGGESGNGSLMSLQKGLSLAHFEPDPTIDFTSPDQTGGVRERMIEFPDEIKVGYGFRIVVEDSPTVFNKGSSEACIYDYSDAEITADSVNARELPGSTANKIGIFMKNDKGKVILRSHQKQKLGTVENYWYLFYQPEEMRAGWVYGEYVEKLK